MDLKSICAFVLLGISSCAHPASRDPSALAATVLPGTDGRAHALVDPDARFTVVEFFSAHCPCQAMHDERLEILARDLRGEGVTLQLISSEDEMTPAAEKKEAETRGYEFPILHDAGGRIARELGAEYATYSVIFDRAGHVRYRGGLDSDKLTLHDDAQMYVRDVTSDLVRGRPPRRVTAKTLGCALSI